MRRFSSLGHFLWPLADYMVHELEGLVEEIEEPHPAYREVQVPALLRAMT